MVDSSFKLTWQYISGTLDRALHFFTFSLKDKSVLGGSGLIDYMSLGVLRKEHYLSPNFAPTSLAPYWINLFFCIDFAARN